MILRNKLVLLALIFLLFCQGLAAAAEKFSFLVFGDVQGGELVFNDLVDRMAREKDIAFAISTGDYVSNGKLAEYQRMEKTISRLPFKVYHTPGNHDLTGPGEKNYRDMYGPLYYSFDYGLARFIVLNNAFKAYFGQKQFAWLKDELANNDQPNLFVIMHKPVFDPSDIYPSHVMSGTQVTRELMALFTKYHVDYVFAGHIHGYAKDTRDGVIYLVTAGGGAPLYLPANFGGFYHYVKITVDGDKITDKVVKLYD